MAIQDIWDSKCIDTASFERCIWANADRVLLLANNKPLFSQTVVLVCDAIMY